MRIRRVIEGFFFLCAAILLACVLAFPHESHADATADQRAALEAQLAQVQAQIQQNQEQLATEQAAANTYQNEVNTVNSQIKEAQLEIQQRNLTIQELNDGITQDNQGISQVNANVSAGEASLAQILRDTQQMDNESLAELALGSDSLSELFQDESDFGQIQQALGTTFTQLAAQKSDLSNKENEQQTQQTEQSSLLQLQQLQKQSLQQTESQKQQLANQAKGQVNAYQTAIASQQQTVTQIEQALFALADTNTSVSFGSMVNYANEASTATGVPAAFILGILSEESDLGQNVGTCSYEEAMSPKRDIPDYLTIMSQLNLSPDSEEVSCAQSYGAYGGAMGPAQFIPSTWMLYQSRIAQATGQNPPNPWDPRTATFATALYMSDLGASAGTTASEREAALKYIAGSDWQNPAYAFYWQAVEGNMEKYEGEINQINGS